MDRYEFNVKLCGDRCVKMFLNSIEMKTLDFHSLMQRILERVPSLCGKEVALKYLDDRENWVDLPIGDLDSFIDMVETARNSKIIQLKVNELANTDNTPQDGAKHGVSQKRSRVSPSPSPKSADAVLVHMAKKSRSLSAYGNFTQFITISVNLII